MPTPPNFPASKNDISANFRTALYGPRRAFMSVTSFRESLYTLAADGQKDTVKAQLVNLYGFSTTESDEMVEAVESLYTLAQVSTAQGTVPSPNDFFYLAKKYWGINI